MSTIKPIPGPRGLPIIGNLLDIQHEQGNLRATEHLADIYGPVYQVTVGGRKLIFVSSAELLIQFMDEKVWMKSPSPALGTPRQAQGLVPAASTDPDWQQAHRILTPAFGTLPVGEMFGGMRDIANQLCEKFARLGQDPDHQFLLTDEFTRLSLDTIAYCTMDFRFNSFYSDAMHPFVDAMVHWLGYASKRSTLPSFYNRWFAAKEEAQWQESATTMNRIGQSIIDIRRKNPVDKPDMLNTLIYGKDPKTGESMRDELIVANMIVFLVAGHETTSGLLSFLFVNFIQNPATYLKAREEVDRVVGDNPVQLHHLKDLNYLRGAMRETLRLTPIASAIGKSVSNKEDFITICDGQYHIPPDVSVRLLLGKCMRDPEYWGDDAENFIPERMMDDHPDFKRHMAGWRPFGNGSRACIGQGFAFQEATLIVALLLQSFDIDMANPGYVLSIKQNLTIKPNDLWVKVKLREGVSTSELARRLHGGSNGSESKKPAEKLAATTNVESEQKVNILYGSNGGTCSSLAHKLASAVTLKLGMTASVDYLDTAVGNLPTDQLTIVITASYEGQPPDNAARFTAWLEGSSSINLSGLSFAVFGCGHKDWSETLHRIPKLLDGFLEKHGGDRILSMGASDVSQGNVLDDFEEWQEQLLQKLRSQMKGSADQAPVQSMAEFAEISKDSRATQLSSGLNLGKVKSVKVLTAPNQPEKRHMEIELPQGTEYECGDYLAVLPMNPESLVKKIMAHYELPWDATITLKSKVFGNVPIGEPLSIFELLKGYFELSQQVTKTNLNSCVDFSNDEKTKKELQAYLSEVNASSKQVPTKHLSLFDVLKQHPQVKMPFTDFLSHLLPLHVRQYSISSSPMHDQRMCTITYSVVNSGPPSTELNRAADAFEGVATTYLASLKPGDTFQIAIRKTATANLACPFRLPQGAIQAKTPLLMFCAGTGLAPFRGFIEQRAKMLEQNPSLELAPALLFVGCRTAKGDRLYADELAKWQKLGAVDVRYAFSQESDHELAAGCKYVGDRMLNDMDDLRKIWKAGARVYICGGRRLQDSVKEGVVKLFDQIAETEKWTPEVKTQSSEKFKNVVAGRAVSDIFD